MSESRWEALHELLSRIARTSTAQELRNVMNEYADKLDVSGDEPSGAVWKDIKKLGDELVLLRGERINGAHGRHRTALTEQEQAELAEVERIIDQNLLDYHFQPIVSAVNGEIYSYEALMRPQSQLCPSPYHVMKYAELTERLDDIERATFLNILGIIDSGKERFGGRRVFINSIPRTKLADSDSMRVNELLEKHSDTVVVEMTEQAELNDVEFGVIKEQYRRMNVRIAIDDYGTGYSNVQNLLRYMPDYIKIDRSLLSEIQNNPKKRHFVREIIEFCHDNGIKALAEGVETSEELRTVIHLGADLIQGYYTARPCAVILDSVPNDIKSEIKLYHREREDGKELHIYTAHKSERVLLDRLFKEDYRCVLVGKNGDGDVTLACAPGLDTKIHLDIADGFKGSIILENAQLSNEKNRSCIDVGENCDVRLILIGTNHLKRGGIRVPESSRITFGGEGRLSIMIGGEGCYAIGNDVDSRHGELVFEQGVSVENYAAYGVCIGSGRGGKISILRGQFSLNMTGSVGVGIGALYADTDLDLFACDVTADISLAQGVAIGSLSGNCHAYVHSASTKLYLTGNDIVGIGTLSGRKSEVAISEATAIFNIHADHCSAVAALEGDTSFKLSRAGMHVAAEGARALAFGGFDGNTELELINSNTSIRLDTYADYKDYISRDNVEISGGRTRVVINGTEIGQGITNSIDGE